MVMFPLEGDQPLNALFGESLLFNGLSVADGSSASDRGVAIELMQVRTGMTVGLPTMRGITPIDDKVTRRDEMRDVWRRIRGKEGLEMLERVKAMKKVVVDSEKRGESHKAMRGFDKWIAKTT